MKLIGIIFLSTVAGGLCLFFLPLLGGLLGAFSGWIIGFWFPGTMKALLEWMHLTVQPWQLGVMLGFVSGFFRSYTYNEKNS